MLAMFKRHWLILAAAGILAVMIFRKKGTSAASAHQDAPYTRVDNSVDSARLALATAAMVQATQTTKDITDGIMASSSSWL